MSPGSGWTPPTTLRAGGGRRPGTASSWSARWPDSWDRGSRWRPSRSGCSTPTARSSCWARTASAAPTRAAGGGCRRSSTARSSGWSATGADLWWEAGPPPSDPVAVAAPWGRRAARAVLALRDRAGTLLGVAEAWWRASRTGVRRRHPGPAGGGGGRVRRRARRAPRLRPHRVGDAVPAVFAAFDQIADSALLARPLRGAGGEITDFAIVYLSPGYADPLGRPAAELASLTLLEAYPGLGVGRRPVRAGARVLASGHAEHVPGIVSAPLADGQRGRRRRERRRKQARGDRGPGRHPVLRRGALHLADAGRGRAAGRAARPRAAPRQHRRLGGAARRRRPSAGPIPRSRSSGSIRPRRRRSPSPSCTAS